MKKRKEKLTEDELAEALAEAADAEAEEAEAEAEALDAEAEEQDVVPVMMLNV